MKKIAIVVQRYGKEVLGGSESLARDIARMLSSAYDVEVLTTCALEYSTWANYFPEGVSVEDGITIRRFKVDKGFRKFFWLYSIFVDKLRIEAMERIWMRMLGPYSSGLFDHIRSAKNDYEAFIFVTYLYATSYYGLPIVPEKSILVPTAHDEPQIHYAIYRDLYHSAGSIIFLTNEEKSIVNSIFGGFGNDDVLGAPVEEHEGAPDAFRKKYAIDGDFILYVGRLDVMKGVGPLLEYFERYIREKGSSLKLVLCGSGPMKVLRTDHVIPVGYVPEEDKFGAIRAATVMVQPSLYESFSYSLIESMLCGTPVLVNGKCSVLKGHCEKSGGGLSYDSYESFARSLDMLLGDADLRKRMSEAGNGYAKDHYSPAVVRKKYISTIESLVQVRQKQP